MNWLAFIVMVVAALLFLGDWYLSGPRPRRFASIAFGLFVLTVGLILVFVLQIDPVIRVVEK